MRKNGFTLIELLAIVVVLSIIALIAGPILIGVVEDGRKKVFETDVKSIEKEIISYATETGTIGTFTINNGNVILDEQNVDVKFKGEFNGTVDIDEDGNSQYAINNGKWCSIKEDQSDPEILDYNENTCKISQ